jgi:hypothetical protein
LVDETGALRYTEISHERWKGTKIAVQITPQGVLIPQAAVHQWIEQGLEIVKDEQRIIIQPRPAPRTKRERVLRILEESGLLVKPRWEPVTPPVSPEERAELAKNSA